jgi:hypothetical protein
VKRKNMWWWVSCIKNGGKLCRSIRSLENKRKRGFHAPLTSKDPSTHFFLAFPHPCYTMLWDSLMPVSFLFSFQVLNSGEDYSSAQIHHWTISSFSPSFFFEWW